MAPPGEAEATGSWCFAAGRGGYGPWGCCAAYRDNYPPDYRLNYIGFRVSWFPIEPPAAGLPRR